MRKRPGWGAMVLQQVGVGTSGEGSLSALNARGSTVPWILIG